MTVLLPNQRTEEAAASSTGMLPTDLTLQEFTSAAMSAAISQAKAGNAFTQAGTLLKVFHTRLVLISRGPALTLVQKLEQQQQQPQHQQDSPASTSRHAPAAAASMSGGLARMTVIAIPPLRARSSDVAPLALQAAAVQAAKRGYNSVKLTDAAVRSLTSYKFPFNEAELEALVQRAVMLHPAAPPISPVTSHTQSLGMPAAGGMIHHTTSSKPHQSSPQLHPALVLDAADFWQVSKLYMS